MVRSLVRRPDDERRVMTDESVERAFRRARLNERLRAEFIAGAEEDSRRRLGRALTAKELERVLRRYPGDI